MGSKRQRSLFDALLNLGAGLVPVPDAVYEFASVDVVGSQASWKNRLVAAAVSKNIIYNSSGFIPSEGTFSGGSITQHFADGPNYTKGAAKVNINAQVGGETSGAFYKPFFNRNFPVGTYTFKCKIKTAVPGVTQKIRYGFTTTSPANLMDADDTWQDLTMNFTSSNAGSNYYMTIGAQISLGAQSVLIDELQLYSTADTIPAYTDDGNDGHINKPYGARFPITKNGDFVTSNSLAILSPAYPVPKNWTEMTIVMVFRVTSSATQVLFSATTDSFYGTTEAGLSIVVSSGELAPTIANKLGTGNLNGQGFVMAGFTYKATPDSSDFFINDLMIETSTDVAFTALNAQILTILGRFPANSVFVGDVAYCKIWDARLSRAQCKTAAHQARQYMATIGAPLTRRNWYIGEGDSITASYSPPQGQSFAYKMTAETFTGSQTTISHLNLATGGHNLATVEGDLAYMLQRIREVSAGGGKCIVSLLIGRNDNATLISNAACNAYWVRLKAYYAACRNAGAYVIAITCLPSGTIATNGGPSGSWETYRLYLRGLMLADSTAYDAIADFGDPATTMGNVTNANNATYYDSSDMVHPYPAGHTLLAALIKPIIQGLLDL